MHVTRVAVKVAGPGLPGDRLMEDFMKVKALVEGLFGEDVQTVIVADEHFVQREEQ